MGKYSLKLYHFVLNSLVLITIAFELKTCDTRCNYLMDEHFQCGD